MFLFYVLSFFKKGDTIQGGTLVKGGHYLRKYGKSYFFKKTTNLGNWRCSKWSENQYFAIWSDGMSFNKVPEQLGTCSEVLFMKKQVSIFKFFPTVLLLSMFFLKQNLEYHSCPLKSLSELKAALGNFLLHENSSFFIKTFLE